MELPVLAIDVDEVLAQYLYSCNEWHNRTYNTNYTVSDYKSYTFCETWGCTDEEARKRVYSFYESDEFSNLPVVPGAVEGVERLAAYFTLVVVTSRQDFIRDVTLKWLEKHFGPERFASVLFGNVWVAESGAKRRTKSDMCRSVGAIALIDDLPCYIYDVSQCGIIPILFNRDGAQKWSKIPPARASLIPNLRVCESWEAVVRVCSTFVKEQQVPRNTAAAEELPREISKEEAAVSEGIQVRAV